MRAYLFAPADGYTGEGVYGLIAEDGEVLGEHICSSAGFARHDLTAFPKRKEVIAAKGITEVRWVGDDATTWGELLARNGAWYEAHTGDHAATSGRAEKDS